MKRIKLLSFLSLGLLVSIVLAMANVKAPLFPSPDLSAVLNQTYSEHCLPPEINQRPVWECYEVIASGPIHQTVTIRHESGEIHKVLTFGDQSQTKFRFTPTQTGLWTFSTGGSIDINTKRPDYAKGFVSASGSKWIRTATHSAFIPQFVMYDKSNLDEGLDEFVEEHGFTGFHITNLRDFMDNPAYFEAAVLKTYRRGGVTHFWIWEDKRRRVTPDTYGVDVNRLYSEIAARLAPIPGWTVGYGFDLFEWATADEVEAFRSTLQKLTSYHHMVGGRGHKNIYQEISSNLDYASWEWHRPTYQDYLNHIEEAKDRPAFSEDRFRIRTPSRYPGKDYNPDLTLQGLWNSAMAGGVANIWGYKPQEKDFSEPYPNKNALKTYSLFIDKTFSVGMQPDANIIENGYCLRDHQTAVICYTEEVNRVSLNLSYIETPTKIIAVDTQSAYKEIDIPFSNTSLKWSAPYTSNWALSIMGQVQS